MPKNKPIASALGQQARSDPAQRRIFGVDDANRALPYVSRVVADIIDLHVNVVRIRRMMTRISLGQHCEDDKDRFDAEYKAAMLRLRFLIHELDAVGVSIYEFEHGIITFPAMRDGREVSLSWKLGESKISYWYELTEGLDSRRHINDTSY